GYFQKKCIYLQMGISPGLSTRFGNLVARFQDPAQLSSPRARAARRRSRRRTCERPSKCSPNPAIPDGPGESRGKKHRNSGAGRDSGGFQAAAAASAPHEPGEIPQQEPWLRGKKSVTPRDNFLTMPNPVAIV